MLRRVTQNWQLKLLSLGIALVVWVYVLEQSDPWEQKDVSLTVAAAGLANDEMATEVKPAAVTATFEGRREALALLAAKPPEAVANVGGRAIGEYEVPVTVPGGELPRGVRLKRLAVEDVTVTLDERTQEKRVLWVDVRGRTAPEFRVQSYDCTVKQVTLSGPREMVANARAVAPVDVSGLNANKTLEARVEVRDTQGVRLDKVLVSPAQVEVTIHLDRVNVKTVPIILGRVRVPAGERVTSVSLDPQVVTLSGEPGALLRVEAVATEPLTVQGAGGHYTLQLRAPGGTTIASDSSVRVSVELGSAEAGPQAAPPETPPTEGTPRETPAPAAQPGEAAPGRAGTPEEPATAPGPEEQAGAKAGGNQGGASEAAGGTKVGPAGRGRLAPQNTERPPG